jgi:hypothetical protein
MAREVPAFGASSVGHRDARQISRLGSIHRRHGVMNSGRLLRVGAITGSTASPGWRRGSRSAGSRSCAP